jgi:hypothetical protein
MANAIVVVDDTGRNGRTESPVHLILYGVCTSASETHVFLKKIKVRSHVMRFSNVGTFIG